MQENIIGNLDSAAHTPFSHVGPRGDFKKLNAVLDAPKAHHNTPSTAHHLKPKLCPTWKNKQNDVYIYMGKIAVHQ